MYPLFLMIPSPLFLEMWGFNQLCISLLYSIYIQRYEIEVVSHQISFPYSWGYFDKACSFFVFNFLKYRKSYHWVLTVSTLFLQGLSRIFVVTIQWWEDTPSKEEYASQSRVLFIYIYIMKKKSICAIALLGLM